MPKPRRKFTLELLQEALSRDDAVLIEVPGKFTSMAVAQYTCGCGSEGSRRVDECIDFGAFCKPCAKATSISRALATKANNALREISESEYYDLFTERDEESVRYHKNDVVSLALVPTYHKPSLEKAKGCVRIRWWDENSNQQKSRCINTTKPDCKEIAHKFMQKKAVILDAYRITITLSELFKQLIRFKYYCRIPADIADYASQDIPSNCSDWLYNGLCN